MRYRDRTEAGQVLAQLLDALRNEDLVVLGLPRGGVPVAFEVARALEAPLDVLVARKLGAPGHEELGIGAVAEGGATYHNTELLEVLGVSPQYLADVTARELAEIERRVARYRGVRPARDVAGKTVVLVDDGLATGVTTRAALRALRARGPREVVLAVPVCARDTAETIAREEPGVRVLCPLAPEDFHAVGLWYDDFAQTSDDEVVELLETAAQEWGERLVDRGSQESHGRRSTYAR